MCRYSSDADSLQTHFWMSQCAFRECKTMSEKQSRGAKPCSLETVKEWGQGRKGITCMGGKVRE